MVIDINQGSLPAILPFLKTRSISRTRPPASSCSPANITSSLIQPLFGYLADKTARRWLLPLSVLLSAVGSGLARAGPVVLRRCSRWW